MSKLTANKLTSSKFANQVKNLVSKDKTRFQEDGYDLDLTYIKPNLIAMGFPASNFEAFYRNAMEDVYNLLEEKHKDKYRVYNLCTEREYDVSKFHGRVATFQFIDHQPPPIGLIKPFCQDVANWLKVPDCVAVVHCKAGKGRTGVMICCYLIHSGQQKTAAESLMFYAQTRTRNKKGVTIPSQIRYVNYYEHLVRLGELPVPIESVPDTNLLLKGIKLTSLPKMTGNFSPQIVICKGPKPTKIFESQSLDVNSKKFERDVCFEPKHPILVAGDILINFYNKTSLRVAKERLFQFWFNTFMVQEGLHQGDSCDDQSDLHCLRTDKPVEADHNGTNSTAGATNKIKVAQSFTFDQSGCIAMHLKKSELDKASKDRSHNQYQANFKVICYFQRTDEKLGNSHTPLHGTASLAESEFQPGDDLSDDERSEDGLVTTV